MEFVREGVVPLLGMLLSTGAIIAIVWIVTNSRQRRAEIQAELQSKLLDRFGSSAELVAFLQSSAGRAFVTGVQTTNRVAVQDRILSGYRRAIIFSFLGAAFLVMWAITGILGLAWPGVLVLALGLGYFAATIATAKLSRSTETALTQPTQAVQIPEM
jgi:hypothetical protein